MTLIPPPPVARALPQIARAQGFGSFDREPIDDLLTWLKTFREHGNVDLDPSLKNALRHASPGCATLESKLGRFIELIEGVLSGRQNFTESDHTFLRIVPTVWLQSLAARMV